MIAANRDIYPVLPVVFPLARVQLVAVIVAHNFFRFTRQGLDSLIRQSVFILFLLLLILICPVPCCDYIIRQYCLVVKTKC